MIQLRDWYMARSLRERWLIAVMLGLLLPVFAWLGIYGPLMGALDEARDRHVEAVRRHGQVLASVAGLRQGVEVRSPGAATDLVMLVGESASRSGVSLTSNDPRGPDAVAIGVAAAPSTSVLRWLRELEGQGVMVRELAITPGADGTVSVTAQLVSGRG